MEGSGATPSRRKRTRSKEASVPDFFGTKVKALLLRTRNVVQALPRKINGPALALLADLDGFSDATSVKDVLSRLGGENALAAQIFMSVADESEKRQLELYEQQRQGPKQQQFQELVVKELENLMIHVQQLAQQLPTQHPLVEQVLALASASATAEDEEEEDEAGTGDQEEESLMEEKNSRNV